ncbi:RNA-binding protein 26-like [Penaeus indicus]|uniref:RNA-binding protein 26-like n=1 Tax=Penaeus indicus TaxID=29960 RepID=UPI00300C4D43
MIIDHPELLKQWLTGFLAPLCDADPEALAKYCLALVRKDRPISELKAGMIEQLDVFLQSNTKSFVDKFLQVTTTRSIYTKELQFITVVVYRAFFDRPILS